MSTFIDSCSLPTSKVILKSKQASVFREELNRVRVVSFLSKDLILRVGERDYIIMDSGELGGSVKQTLINISDTKLDKPVMYLIYLNSHVTISLEGFSYCGGVMNLAITALLHPEANIVEVQLEDLQTGMKKIFTRNCSNKLMFVNIYSLSKEAQFYFRLEEICTRSSNRPLLEDSKRLSNLLKEVCNHYQMMLGNMYSAYLGKSLILEVLASASREEIGELEEIREIEIKRMMSSIKDSLGKIVTELYQHQCVL